MKQKTEDKTSYQTDEGIKRKKERRRRKKQGQETEGRR